MVGNHHVTTAACDRQSMKNDDTMRL